MNQVNYYAGALAGATIPKELIIEPTDAWMVVLALLALCCALLWFLTQERHDASAADSTPARRRLGAGPQRRRSPTARRQGPRPPLLAPRPGRS